MEFSKRGFAFDTNNQTCNRHITKHSIYFDSKLGVPPARSLNGSQLNPLPGGLYRLQIILTNKLYL